MAATHDEQLEELLNLKPSARVLRMLELGMVPLAGGAEGAEGGDGEPDGDGEPAGDGDGKPADSGKEPEEDWKAHSRKHENRAKAERKRADTLAAELEELKQAGASEHEQALAQARKEAAEETAAKYEQERRHDRLEVASTRLGARGFELGDGDDKETVKFADPDDALIYVERGIARGEIDESDIFDDEGKVQTGALQTALAEILESKPHLRASENGNGTTARPRGGADAGKGRGPATADELSVDDHLAHVQGRKK